MTIVEETLPLKIQSNQHSMKWDVRFLEVSKLISSWSKDPSTKVGAIAVNSERRILAQGYNGFPSGTKDDLYRYSEPFVKHQMVVHAESNVIYNACNFRVGLDHATIYVFGMYPCPECVKALGQVGVARIVFQLSDSKTVEKWKQLFDISRQIMHELNIGFTQYK
jgi:dCMP deaminase